jgi:response regulator of citrate/malate metabolism
MQETYQAVIVEDDPMIASIDQNFLERDPRFHLAARTRCPGCCATRRTC